MHTYMYVCMYIYIYIYIYIHTYTHLNRWYEVREELEGENMLADAGIIEMLKTARAAMYKYIHTHTHTYVHTHI